MYKAVLGAACFFALTACDEIKRRLFDQLVQLQIEMDDPLDLQAVF